jgi:hypothetical protein
MTTKMSQTLNIISNDIMSGSSYEESGFYEQSENRRHDKTIYDEMKNYYDVYIK